MKKSVSMYIIGDSDMIEMGSEALSSSIRKRSSVSQEFQLTLGHVTTHEPMSVIKKEYSR